jgi:hypothetical protein
MFKDDLSEFDDAREVRGMPYHGVLVVFVDFSACLFLFLVCLFACKFVCLFLKSGLS